MKQIKETTSNLLGSLTMKVLLASTLFLLSVTLLGNLKNQPQSVPAYETVEELPPFVIQENRMKNELQVNPPVFRLHTGKASKLQSLMGKKDNEFVCTAFVISDTYAITAGHCVDDNGELASDELSVFIQYMNEETGLPDVRDAEMKVVPVGINRRGDTALLMGNFSSFRKLLFTQNPDDIKNIIAQNLSLLGGQFVSVGFPYGDAPMTVNVRFLGTYYFHFKGVGNLYPGMSGGPLIDPVTGAVIGINSSVSGDGTSNFSSLIGFLESLNVRTVQ